MSGWLVLGVLAAVLYACCAFLVGVVVGHRLAESCVSPGADEPVERRP